MLPTLQSLAFNLSNLGDLTSLIILLGLFHDNYPHNNLSDANNHDNHKETYSKGKAGKIFLREIPMWVIMWLISSVLGSSVMNVYTLPSTVSTSCNQPIKQSVNQSVNKSIS